MVFDLDHFKTVNDRFGHGIGDETLRLFAATIGSNMRASDIVGRLGGEEFVAILPSTVTEAAMVANRVREAFQATAVTVAGEEVNGTVSIGVASGEPGAEVSTMLAAADAALYRAKEGGRNRVEAAEETVPAVRPVTGPRRATVAATGIGVPAMVRVRAR